MKTPRLKFLLFSLLALLLFASCGKEGDAKSMVEDFLDTYLVDNARSDTRFSRMDSTKMITPATVMALREHMKTVKLFKPNVSYAEGNIPKTLYYIRVTYTKPTADGKGKSYTQTFYFDPEVKRLIAFKEG